MSTEKGDPLLWPIPPNPPGALSRPGRFQAYDQQYLKHAGIDPAKKSVVAVKSAQHFRAAYAPIAREIHVVDGGGGLTSANFKDLPFEKVRRPIYPLDLV